MFNSSLLSVTNYEADVKWLVLSNDKLKSCKDKRLIIISILDICLNTVFCSVHLEFKVRSPKLKLNQVFKARIQKRFGKICLIPSYYQYLLPTPSSSTSWSVIFLSMRTMAGLFIHEIKFLSSIWPGIHFIFILIKSLANIRYQMHGVSVGHTASCTWWRKDETLSLPAWLQSKALVLCYILILLIPLVHYYISGVYDI